jgi:hypothetical protein
MVNVTNRTNVAMRLVASEFLFGHDTFSSTTAMFGRKNAVELGCFEA